jgi:hypothetical protein
VDSAIRADEFSLVVKRTCLFISDLNRFEVQLHVVV